MYPWKAIDMGIRLKALHKWINNIKCMENASTENLYLVGFCWELQKFIYVLGFFKTLSWCLLNLSQHFSSLSGSFSNLSDGPFQICLSDLSCSCTEDTTECIPELKKTKAKS